VATPSRTTQATQVVRRLGQVAPPGAIEDGLVGIVQPMMQETRRVAQAPARFRQARARFTAKQLGEVQHGNLRGQFAVEVPAHAVGHHHEQRIAAIAAVDPILVDLAGPETAFLEHGELHSNS